ncbi:MAG: hypothetical protein ACREEN_05490 [Stellaceae bacterium]
MPRPRYIAFSAALLAAGLVAAAPGHAQNSPQQKLQDIEHQIEQTRQQQQNLAKQAQDLAGQIQTLRNSEVRAAAGAQAHEAALDRLDRKLAALAAEELSVIPALSLKCISKYE